MRLYIIIIIIINVGDRPLVFNIKINIKIKKIYFDIKKIYLQVLKNRNSQISDLKPN